MCKFSSYALGATLYMPAVRNDILSVAIGRKIPHLKSMVICLEDSVADNEVSLALSNLKKITQQLAQHADNNVLIFIRPRNLEMAQYIVSQYDLSGVHGFVFPKFTLASFPLCEAITQHTHLLWMPTLETREVFIEAEMQKLAFILSNSPMKERIIALRIGGNDLMNLLRIRRSREMTIYDGPLGHVIKMLCCVFGSVGLSLTSPVFEIINNPMLLQQETKQDILHGLVGKTAIHPAQIEHIQNAWRVQQHEYQDAMRIINSSAAVYQHDGAMYEPATHIQWANTILERSRVFGIHQMDVESLGS